MAGIRSSIYARDDAHGNAGVTRRDVVSAWLVAIVLLAGVIVGVTLDNMVTVSTDPPAAYSAARDAIAAEEAQSEDAASATGGRTEDAGP
jgi:uncharacterized iron-regulated membrane protein